jgi:hypothetical protein
MAEGEADVFGLMTFIAPNRSITQASLSFPLSALSEPHLDMGSVTLFPQVEDFTIPVNFVSTEFFSPEPDQHTEGDTIQEARRAMLQDEASFFDFTIPLPLAPSDDISTSQNPVSSRRSVASSGESGSDGDLTVRPAQPKSHLASTEISITHADLAVPLDDNTHPSTSRRLTRTISKISAGASSHFTDSRVGSRTRDRLATPYRPRKEPVEHVSPEDQRTDGETLGQDFPQGADVDGISQTEKPQRIGAGIEDMSATAQHSRGCNDTTVKSDDAKTKPDTVLHSAYANTSPDKPESYMNTRSGRLFRWSELADSEGLSNLDTPEFDAMVEAARSPLDTQLSDIYNPGWPQEEPIGSEGMNAVGADLRPDFPLADEPAILPKVPSSPPRQWMFPPLVKG